ncbi:type I restriction enzyme S subunit [Paenibacillus sp. DS2015]|uniref:restriction endonuclease subunit S n=1 Tax=Paenibacillus sp. DS2015 TaxID=3373917 RepID=UPI003D19305F
MSLYKFYKKSNPSVGVAKIVFNYLCSNVPLKKVGEIAESTSGGTPSRGNSEYYGGDIPWIKSGELNDSYITSCEEYLTEEGIKNSSAKLYPKGTLVLALYGATVGKVGILDFEAASNQAVCAIYPNNSIDKDYMFWFFKQKRQEFIESSFGGAQPNISQKVVKETDIPVPSLEIQKEVVTFLNQCEFEGIIDKEFQNNEVLKQIERFFNVRTCCEELENSMKMTEGLILSLRQSILQEAVQGKLVPQDPSDEPVSVLLGKIKAEKEQLIKEKKIKKEKPLPLITEDEIPYELPKEWKWARLGDICNVITDGDHQPPPQTANGINFLVISNVSKGTLSFENTRFVSKEYYDALPSFKKPNKGDILFTVTGSYGIPIIIDTDKEFCFQRHIALLRPSANISTRYLYWVLLSNLVKTQCDESATGIAQKTVSLTTLRNLRIPILPLNKQKRVVEKVDHLMILCAELEKTVVQSKQESEMLMQAVLQEAFNSTEKENNVVNFPLADTNNIEDWEIAARSDGEIDLETKAKIKARVTELLGKSKQ